MKPHHSFKGASGPSGGGGSFHDLSPTPEELAKRRELKEAWQALSDPRRIAARVASAISAWATTRTAGPLADIDRWQMSAMVAAIVAGDDGRQIDMGVTDEMIHQALLRGEPMLVPSSEPSTGEPLQRRSACIARIIRSDAGRFQNEVDLSEVAALIALSLAGQNSSNEHRSRFEAFVKRHLQSEIARRWR